MGSLCRGLFRGRKQIHDNMLKIPKEINTTRIILIEIYIIFNKQTDKMFMFKKLVLILLLITIYKLDIKVRIKIIFMGPRAL